MRYNFPPIFYTLLSFWIIKIILILILIGIFIGIKYLFKPNKKDLYKYQIKHFYINWIIIGIYISFFIIFLFYLRIIRSLGLDLKPILNQIHNIYVGNSLLNNIYIVIIVIILIGILLRLLKYIIKLFLMQLYKRHIFLLHAVTFYNFKLKTNRILYNGISFYFFSNLSNLYLKNYIFGKIVRNNVLYSMGRLLKFPTITLNSYLIKLGNFILFLLKIVPTFIIVLLVVYDIWYNNLIITKVFYYLIFYSIYNIWKRYSDFLENYDDTLGEILFNLYYREDTVMYVNMPDEWEDLLYEFIDKGLQNYNTDIDTLAMYLEVNTKYKYLSKDGRFYWRSDGEGYDKENL